MRCAPSACLVLALSVVSRTPVAHAAPAVGVTTIQFDKTAVGTGAPRSLPTTVWYPAKARTGTAEALGLRDAKVKPGRYPLIVYSHGSCGRPREATYYTMALAAQGYVVAAPPHPPNTADDANCFTPANFGESFVNRVADVRFVLDGMLAQAVLPTSLFQRRIRTDRLGVTGLSFGGYTTLSAAQQEPRFDAALAMVPGGSAALAPAGISIPTMVIGSEKDQIVGYAESERAYQLLHGPRYLLELLNANHLSVVDECFNRETNLNLCVPGAISQEDAHALVLRYALPFFRRYLRGQRPAGRQLLKQIPGVVLTAEPKRAGP